MKTLITILLVILPTASMATTIVCKTTGGEVLLVFSKNNQVGIQWVMKGSSHGKIVEKNNKHTVIITLDNKGSISHRFTLNNKTLRLTEYAYNHPVNGISKTRKYTGSCIEEWP